MSQISAQSLAIVTFSWTTAWFSCILTLLKIFPSSAKSFIHAVIASPNWWLVQLFHNGKAYVKVSRVAPYQKLCKNQGTQYQHLHHYHLPQICIPRIPTFGLHMIFLLGTPAVLLKTNYLKVRKAAKIRNRYNQVPHLPQETTRESDKTQ